MSAEPPEILYHATSPKAASMIVESGLKPMGRQYVHLSVDIATAKQVGSRKSAEPEIMLIRAREAHSEGVCFYIGNEHVWLADNIPPKFIQE